MEVEKIIKAFEAAGLEYKLEVIDDLKLSLELNVFNPPALIANGKIIFDKAWPSEEKMLRIIDLLK